MSYLTPCDPQGVASMIDITAKEITQRTASAFAAVYVTPDVLQRIAEHNVKKGDVLAVTRVAGIMAAKRTAELIPLCHPLALSSVTLDLNLNWQYHAVEITARCKTTAQTGVEMEALTAVTIAALTLYDMCKGLDRNILISNVQLLKKHGGKSDSYIHDPLKDSSKLHVSSRKP